MLLTLKTEELEFEALCLSTIIVCMLAGDLTLFGVSGEYKYGANACRFHSILDLPLRIVPGTIHCGVSLKIDLVFQFCHM